MKAPKPGFNRRTNPLGTSRNHFNDIRKLLGDLTECGLVDLCFQFLVTMRRVTHGAARAELLCANVLRTLGKVELSLIVLLGLKDDATERSIIVPELIAMTATTPSRLCVALALTGGNASAELSHPAKLFRIYLADCVDLISRAEDGGLSVDAFYYISKRFNFLGMAGMRSWLSARLADWPDGFHHLCFDPEKNLIGRQVIQALKNSRSAWRAPIADNFVTKEPPTRVSYLGPLARIIHDCHRV
jgi:hypothetical protein